jgi:hypothetical protein
MLRRLRLPELECFKKTFLVSYLLIIALVISLFLPSSINPWPSFRAYFFERPAPVGKIPDATDVGSEIAQAEEALRTRGAPAAVDGPQAVVRPCSRDPKTLQRFGHLVVPCLPDAPDGSHALSRFFERLELTRDGRELTRVSYFADSITSGDKITSTLRNRFQRAFGCGGPGYVAVFPLRPWHYHAQVGLQLSPGWKPYCPIGHPSRERRYGFGGISIGHQGTGNTVKFHLKTADTGTNVVQVHFLRHPEGGSFAVTADGRRVRVVDTQGEKFREDFVRVPFPSAREIVLESVSAGILRLGAVFFEKDAPGVVVDSVSLTGARYENWASLPAGHLRAEVTARAPDLVAFQFGLNESDTGVETHYRELIVDLLFRLRAARPLSCLVVGPSDKVEKHNGRYRTLPVIHEISRLQKEAALAAGCAWFDTLAAMGGETAIVRWYDHRPRLAMGDLTHITSEGGELMGNLIYHDLLLAAGAQ